MWNDCNSTSAYAAALQYIKQYIKAVHKAVHKSSTSVHKSSPGAKTGMSPFAYWLCLKYPMTVICRSLPASKSSANWILSPACIAWPSSFGLRGASSCILLIWRPLPFPDSCAWRPLPFSFHMKTEAHTLKGSPTLGWRLWCITRAEQPRVNLDSPPLSLPWTPAAQCLVYISHYPLHAPWAQRSDLWCWDDRESAQRRRRGRVRLA